jgi:hypothetical protein
LYHRAGPRKYPKIAARQALDDSKDEKAGQVMHLTGLFVGLRLPTGLLLNLKV